MALDRDLAAAIAATRFGLGAKPGEILLASDDPQAWLLARDAGADGRMHMTVRVAPDRAGLVRAKFGAENIRAT